MLETLAARAEDAGLNAAAPREQRWIDGWLVRYSPGKAKRARCVNAVADGRLSLDERVALAGAVYRDAALPMFVRITPFTRPAGLDAELAARGWVRIDDTRVMVAPELDPSLRMDAAAAAPEGFTWNILDSASFAATVGALRGSPMQQREAHAQRLAGAPVPHTALALVHEVDGAVLACGQVAVEAEFAGLYDVFTAPEARGQGHAARLCRRLLGLAMGQGAAVGYLQVEADNTPARTIYGRLGFADAFAYHYRQAPDA
ncbi:MAG: GNAT family N-acetyltransferase [Rubrivivax sp.]